MRHTTCNCSRQHELEESCPGWVGVQFYRGDCAGDFRPGRGGGLGSYVEGEWTVIGTITSESIELKRPESSWYCRMHNGTWYNKNNEVYGPFTWSLDWLVAAK